jgi:fused signal recognition particle receptor
MLRGLFKKVGQVFSSGRKLDEELLEELEDTLVMSDVSIDTAGHLIQGLRTAAARGEVPTDEDALEVLQDLTASLLGSGDRPLKYAADGITVWLFVGVNGVGKTTSVGKLAHRLSKEGHKPLLAACDTFRAAATEQLQEWGRRADCPVIAAQQNADPASVAHDAIQAARSRGRDIVLIDTAGRLHNKSNLMNELGKIARVTERELGRVPEETLLVLDASTGQNGLAQAQSFMGSAPLSGLILTKWDGTAKGGIILTVARETKLPVKLIGIGEKAEDLIDFHPQKFAQEMFA